MPIAVPAAEISSASTRFRTPHAKDHTSGRLRIENVIRIQPTRHSPEYQHCCISALYSTSAVQQQQRPSLFSWVDSPSQGCCQSANLVHRICRSMHSMRSTTACPAYVGEATASAGEYHCNDFDWEEHKQEVLAQLAVQHTWTFSSATANSAAVDSAKASSATGDSAAASSTHPADAMPAASRIVTGEMGDCASQHASDGSISGTSNGSATSAGESDDSITAVASGQFVQSPGARNPSASSLRLTELELQPKQLHSAAKHKQSGGSHTSAASPQEASNGEASRKQAAAVSGPGSERRTDRQDDADNRAGAGQEISNSAASQKQTGAFTSRAADGVQQTHKGTTKQMAGSGAVSQTRGDVEDEVEVLDTDRQWKYDSSCWESFHARDNATARFYKERRYFCMICVNQERRYFCVICYYQERRYFHVICFYPERRHFCVIWFNQECRHFCVITQQQNVFLLCAFALIAMASLQSRCTALLPLTK